MTAEDISWKVVGARVEAIKDAISTARLPFSVGTTLAFLWMLSLYNFHYGYANTVVARYETAVLQPDACDTSLYHRFHTNVPGENAESQCRQVLELERDEWLKARIEQQVVSVPFVGQTLTVYDLGVVAQFAMLLVGTWFWFASRRESHAIRSVVDVSPKNLGQKKPNASVPISGDATLYPQESSWTRTQYVYAYQTVAHRFLFLTSTGGFAPLLATCCVMSLPIAAAVLEAVSDFESVIVYGLTGLDITARLVCSVFLTLLVVLVYGACVFNELQVAAVLNLWHQLTIKYEVDLTQQPLHETLKIRS